MTVYMLILLCGCQDISGPIKDSTDSVTVNGESFSIEEINKGIKETFNTVLYNHGYHDVINYLPLNKNIILKKDVDYELYFESYNDGFEAIAFPPKIYLVITNIQHPLSSEESPQLYVFGINITEWGLCSDFSYQGHVSQKEMNSFSGRNVVHLGSYTMRIEEIMIPAYETMDDDWKEKVEREIRLYMDENNFYSNKDENLEPGNYHIYVQKFLKSDKDSIIIFEHENGSIYTGFYYFVHEVSGNHPADLNKVSLIESDDEESFKVYIEKVRSDPALNMEYVVK